VFENWATMAGEGGDLLQPVADQLRQASHQLGQPMRLAVVGQIKRGKSTLVNALLSEEVAATGQLELTFTVSEFRYAKERSVFVHFKDGSHKGPLPPEALDSLTVRNPAIVDELRKIRTVEFTMPNDLLHTFHLVDTPGLGSIHLVDAQNTNEFLGVSATFGDTDERAAMEQTLTAMGRTVTDVHDDSKKELDLADAILYLFSRGLNEGDHSVVSQFTGAASGSVTPLRAFAVLSRCDQYWPPDRDLPGSPSLVTYDPMAAASTIIDRYLSDPGIRRLFYTIVPVSGLVGIGACLLTDDEICWLDELRAVETDLLARRLRDAARFATEAALSGIALPVAARRRLIDRLGNWGTLRACGYLRDGLTPAQMRDRLVDDSGVARLRDLIASHFGNRAAVIKLSRGIQDATAAIGQCRLTFQQAGQPVPEVVDLIAERIEQLRLSEHGTAAELSVLSDLYNDELTLRDDELAEILTVTGEYGATWAARLSLPEDTPLPQLVEAADRHAERWASKEQDPTLNRPTLSAARTMRRSYDRLAYQISRAGDPAAGTDGS
jgi:Dynamin family